ncbi:MAG: tetratricopeptide repeat protein [Gemmatimonadota bacterium]
MPAYQLRTLDKAALEGPDGPVPLVDPRGVAMIAMLAVAGPAGASEDELLLRLTPDATAAAGRVELARIAADINDRVPPGAIVHQSRGYALIAGSVALDVTVLPSDRATPEPRFLADLGFEPTPELDEWIAAARRRVAAPEPATPVADRRRSRGALVGGLAAVAVAGVVVFALAGRPRVVDGFAQGDPLIVADLMNTTGDTLFDRSLATAAAIELQQSARLRLYPRSRLADVYHRMQLAKPDSVLTFEIAQQVAERDNVRFVLGLEVRSAGTGFRISGRIADVRRHAVVAEATEESATPAGVIPALDRVLTTVRLRLGESVTDLRVRTAPLSFVTTASLEALRSYSDGANAWARGDYPVARELWDRAIDLDTGFAMAYGSLGSWYYYHHDRAAGERYFGEAVRRASRLTEREQLRLTDRYLGYRGKLDSSVIVSGVVAKKYPNVSTWYNYGTALMEAGRFTEAIPALEQALRYDSAHVNSYINLASSAAGRREYQRALGYYAIAERLDSAALFHRDLNHDWGGAFVRVGRWSEAEAVFRRMAAKPGLTERGLGLRSLGYLALWQGHVREATGHFAAAVEASRQSRDPLAQTRYRLLLSSASRLGGDARSARVQIDSVITLVAAPSLEPRFLADVVDQAVRAGRLDAADSALRILTQRVDTARKADVVALNFARGAILLARGNADSSVSLLKAAVRSDTSAAALAYLARAYESQNRLDSALATLQLMGHSSLFGNPGQEDWWRAPSLRAGLLQKLGRKDEAVEQLRLFLDRAKSADADLPDVADARRRLAGLGSRA